jgi:carbon-monoxide dehydrogenase medium subunit
VEALRYEAPKTVQEAVELLAEGNGDARVLAGGTDLIVQMHGGHERPQLIVDVKRIPEMLEIEFDGNQLRLGAAVPCVAIREQRELREVFPGFLEAVKLIGSEQIQGRASVGGNLCNASPAADTVPALVALGAECVIAGPNGTRSTSVESFVVGPGETVLRTGELLTELRIPVPQPGSGDAYLRFTPRTEMDIAVVGVGVCVTVDSGGTCTGARVALGAVAPTVIRAPDAEEMLVGTDLGEGALDRAAEAARAAARPIDDARAPAWYRRHLSGVLTHRALATARERARGRG